MKIRKDDNVLVISWKDKGQTGKVLKVLTKTNKVIVEWVKVATKHMKKMWANPGQIIKKENPIDVSNVMLVCPYTSKPTRVWFVFIEDMDNQFLWTYYFWRKKVKNLLQEGS